MTDRIGSRAIAGEMPVAEDTPGKGVPVGLETFVAEYREIIEAASDRAIERVILDLRHNMGGDDSTPILETFQDPAIDQPGRLFVIVGPRVYSASTFIADELDRFSDAVLVGEPIGGAPGFLGGAFSITLEGLPIPLVVDIPGGSAAPQDARLTVTPDIAVPLTGAAYFAGRDAALDAIAAR